MSDSLYDWLVFGHIVAAMVWVGGAVLLGVLAIQVLRDPEHGAVARFTANLRVVGPLVLALFAAALLIGAARQSRAAINADRAAARGDHDEARRQLVRWSWGYGLIVLLLIAATWDMTIKPGL
jgi:uncharacterized membrane protein